MPNFWENQNDEGWVCTELREAATLGDASVESVGYDRLRRNRGIALLYRCKSKGSLAAWVLLAPCDAGVLVNGAPFENGIRHLTDRDAIRLRGQRSRYFSTECLATVTKFPDLENVFCPRCKLQISPGTDAVCCPQCQVWFHELEYHQLEREARLCWSYSEKCSLCDQSTDIDGAEFRWTPESL